MDNKSENPKNYYKHGIDLKKLDIKNDTKENFIQKLVAIDYRGYEVEQLDDGRKIVITKPGGKSIYGKPKKEDFLVFIYEPKENGLWQITHNQILEDLENKALESEIDTLKLLKLLERTLNGGEPNDFIQEIKSLSFKRGEKPEALVKVYKWIWGQEDVNYPAGEGRMMSWKNLKVLMDKLS